jgi:hypothetical protein
MSKNRLLPILWTAALAGISGGASVENGVAFGSIIAGVWCAFTFLIVLIIA